MQMNRYNIIYLDRLWSLFAEYYFHKSFHYVLTNLLNNSFQYSESQPHGNLLLKTLWITTMFEVKEQGTWGQLANKIVLAFCVVVRLP